MNEYNFNLDNKDIKGKNKKLLLLVGILLLAGGISLAYYVGTSLISGTGSSTSGVTATINGSELHVEGTLNFTDDNFYPGHKMVSAIKVTATGDNELIPYNLIWSGTNGISSLNYTVYKTSETINLETTCEKEEKVVDGSQQLSETCTISNIESLGTSISSGSINKNDTKVVLKKDEFINATPAGITMYYYVILEYPNLNEDQSTDIGASITGKVTVEKSNAEPDINILAVYVKGEDGNYTEQSDIPEGYQVNTEKSTCSNGAVPSGITPDVTVKSLTTTGTSCYLYLDEKSLSINDIVADATTTKNDFSTTATTDEGTFLADDPMYGSGKKTTYFRGAVTNNWVKFGGHFWRIIRKNGDGSLRLIYSGTASGTDASKIPNVTIEENGAVAKGIGTEIGKYAYVTSNDSTNTYPTYVGWTYKTGSARPTTTNNSGSSASTAPTNADTAPSSTTTEYRSTAYEQALSWFNSNIPAADQLKVDDGKFCNDRTTQDGGTPATENTSSTYNFAVFKRIYTNKIPNLSCANAGDVYATKVGLITADEVALAGSLYASANQLYYLYTEQDYWTMSPYDWYRANATSYFARIFIVYSNGQLWPYKVSSVYGLRPVINLSPDTQIKIGGTGVYNNPYVVK